MASLSQKELQAVRNLLADFQLSTGLTKPIINQAAQAIEDFLIDNANAISQAINTATSPVVLSVAQKKAIMQMVCELKYRRDK